MLHALVVGVSLLGTVLVDLESPTLQTRDQCKPICARNEQCVGFFIALNDKCKFFSSLTGGEQAANSVAYIKNSSDLNKMAETLGAIYTELRLKRFEGEISASHTSKGTIECAHACTQEGCAGFELSKGGACRTYSRVLSVVHDETKNSKYFIAEKQFSNELATATLPLTTATLPSTTTALNLTTTTLLLTTATLPSTTTALNLTTTTLPLTTATLPSTTTALNLTTTTLPQTTTTTRKFSCDSPWVKFNGFCYLTVTNNDTTMNSAEASCVTRGGHVASIHSKNESNFVYGLRGGNYNWIGLRRDSSTEAWKWTDGSAVDYLEWCPDEPKASSCVYVGYKSNPCWDDYSCTATSTAIKVSHVCKLLYGLKITDSGHGTIPHSSMSMTWSICPTLKFASCVKGK